MDTLEEIIGFENLNINELLIANIPTIKRLGFEIDNGLYVKNFDEKFDMKFEFIKIQVNRESNNDVFLTNWRKKSSSYIYSYIRTISNYFNQEIVTLEEMENEIETNFHFYNEDYDIGINVCKEYRFEIRISINENKFPI